VALGEHWGYLLGMRAHPRFALVLPCLFLLHLAEPLAAQDPRAGLVAGDVVASGTRAGLAHSMVTLEPAGRQTFSTDDGAFSFRGVPPGTYKLRAAHLGFTPTEQTITVPATGVLPRLTVQLEKIQAKLTVVKVLAYPPCLEPGAPDPATDPDFAAIFGQLRQNADQYKLLADSFPFAYRMNRVLKSARVDGSTNLDGVETLARFSNADKSGGYRAGRVFYEANGGGHIEIPTVRDFGSAEFIKNHCFHHGGLDSTQGGVTLRIDFEAADRIRDPDVHGSIFLDTATYQIRVAKLSLSKIPSSSRDIASVDAETIFREIMPSIFVPAEINSFQVAKPDPKRKPQPRDPVNYTEEQNMLEFVWLKTDPRKSVQKP